MGLLGKLFGRQEEPLPLTTLCDQYMVLMDQYKRSQNEAQRIHDRLCKLMVKHGIRRVARKDSLLTLDYIHSDNWRIVISSFDRLDDSYDEDAPGTNLIPLIDRYLEVVGAKQRDRKARDRVGHLIAEIAYSNDTKDWALLDPQGSLVYRGYEFKWYMYHGKYGHTRMDRIIDLDG